MLCTIEQVLLAPGLNNQAAAPIAWLNTLIGAADRAIKSYCKRELELQNLVEYYSGDLQRDIITREYPIICAQTTVSSLSSGVSLPTSTINVTSTKDFPLGTGSNSNATPPSLAVQVGANSWTTVTYTGTTATSFVGCIGGVGSLSSTTGINNVGMPVVYYDPNGYYGQRQGAFPDSSIMTLGSGYLVVLDRGSGGSQRSSKRSNRGLLRRMGDGGIVGGGVGGWDDSFSGSFQGKLGGYRPPIWSRGDGNLCVKYSAGYYPIPFDLSYAAAMLAAYMVRNMPTGAPLSSESLGSYSYSVLSQNNDVPEIGSIQRVLALYREPSF